MMDRTDRHFRYFMRQITRRTLLYTEMITTKAIIHGDRDRLLGFDPIEHPIHCNWVEMTPKSWQTVRYS